MDKKRDTFSSRLGFILATIGFSVGVGTLWRFPYICGEYGGGLFLLTYIVLMFVVGIPLFSAEVSLGLASRKSPVGAYRVLEKPGAKWHIAGYFHMICIVLVIGYTIPVYGWILHYIYATAKGTFLGMDSGQVAQYFADFSANHVLVFGFIMVNAALTALVVKNNLQQGIEKIAKVLLPSLAVIMGVLVIAGLRLPGAAEGVKFIFTLDFDSFSLAGVLTALGQTFFSLGIAMAVAMIFGSYQKEGEINVVKNSVIISVSVIFVAVMASLMIFPMASAFDLEMASGPGLTFITMPNVFNEMAGGRIWGTIFYIGFFIAAFSSGIAGWEAVMAFIMDQFQVSRLKALCVTFVLVMLIGVPALFSDYMFNLFDMLTNNVFLILGSLALSIFTGWIWGMDNMARTCGFSKDTWIYHFLSVMIKYISPIIVVILCLTLFGVIK
ncbi:Na+-dependent transporters of the SNF family [uncultured Eubacterium sp.]|nr:Na+-dependent transporters of the SNF family [uncultured Eubacterium sp.]